jgi:hypothetical protein
MNALAISADAGYGNPLVPRYTATERGPYFSINDASFAAISSIACWAAMGAYVPSAPRF